MGTLTYIAVLHIQFFQWTSVIVSSGPDQAYEDQQEAMKVALRPPSLQTICLTVLVSCFFPQVYFVMGTLICIAA